MVISNNAITGSTINRTSSTKTPPTSKCGVRCQFAFDVTTSLVNQMGTTITVLRWSYLQLLSCKHYMLTRVFQVSSCGPDIVTLVLPMFFSRPSIQRQNLSSGPPRDSDVRTRSPTYKSSHGQSFQNYLDKASRTIMNRSGLNTEP